MLRLPLPADVVAGWISPRSHLVPLLPDTFDLLTFTLRTTADPFIVTFAVGYIRVGVVDFITHGWTDSCAPILIYVGYPVVDTLAP